MELWQVRRDYRQVAVGLRKRREPMDLYLENLEERILVALALCDRFETEISVLRLAVRCGKARLRRLRRWVESAGLMKDTPLSLGRKTDAAALEEMERGLAQRCRESTFVRQALEEVAYLEHRLEDTRARLARLGELASDCFLLLLKHLPTRNRGERRAAPEARRGAPEPERAVLEPVARGG